MKAKVKRIRVNTLLDVDGHRDSFTEEMLEMAKSKQEFEFEPYPFASNWWTSLNGWQFNFHGSWLKDIQE